MDSHVTVLYLNLSFAPMNWSTQIVLFFSLILGIAHNAEAQTLPADSEVLFTLDGEPHTVGEYLQVYRKNLNVVQDEAQKDPRNYLNLYIDYNIKLAQAREAGYDQKESYKKELAGYQQQLAQSYLTDSKATDALVQEAYDRGLQEINASHILIQVDEAAGEEAWEDARRKLVQAKKEIAAGMSFRNAAEKYSVPSPEANGYELGWFSSLAMVYPFETAAYNTPVGEISDPVRTRFGWHLVNVNDRRDARGEIEVSHIMIATQGKQADQAMARIENIQEQLADGAKFEELARQYSDDKTSGQRGGRLNRFGSGALNSDVFEDAAFALNTKGEISPVVETSYGFHLIQLNAKHPIPPLEQIRPRLTDKVERSDRSKTLEREFAEQLLKRYKVNRNPGALAGVQNMLQQQLDATGDLSRKAQNGQDPLVTVGNQLYVIQDYIDFLNAQRSKKYAGKVPPAPLKTQWNNFLLSRVMDYHRNNLENLNPAYAAVLREYKEGLLLFAYLENEIWEKSKTDTLAQRAFYEKNKEQFRQPEQVKVIVASSSNEKLNKKAYKALRKAKDPEAWVNTAAIDDVLYQVMTTTPDDPKLPKNYVPQVGMSEALREENLTRYTRTLEVIPSRIPEFDEVAAQIANQYQQYYEKQWQDNLRTGRTIQVNEPVMKQLEAGL